MLVISKVKINLVEGLRGEKMSTCFFISSDKVLKDVCDESGIINFDNPELNNISIFNMTYYDDIYSGMKYASEISYNKITTRQVQQLVDYITEHMTTAQIAELWRVWIPDYGVPVIRTKEVHISDLSVDCLFDYLHELKNSPYFTTPLHEKDEENNIHYKLKIYK